MFNFRKRLNEESYCHYSDLPSPMAYVEKKTIMKRIIQKVMLWWSYVKPKKDKNSIWKL